YNSGGGNGWVGMGWDLPVPAITVDTSWGVPHYYGGQESENYRLNGESLTPPVQRDVLQPRTAEKEFFPRVISQFRRIIRHGDKPSNYWWEVTDKDGKVSYYGGDSTTGGPAPDSTLTDGSGNIFSWALREVKDLNGNNLQYRCERVEDVGLPGGYVPGFDLYLKTINYTGFNGQAGPYQVKFLRNRDLGEPRRQDAIIDGRGGFKRVTADLLRKVEVTFQGLPVRSYELKYQVGPFFKTLLAAVTQLGEDGSAFYTHTFDYYEDIGNGGGYAGFGGSSAWSTGGDGVSAGLLGQGDSSAINGTKSKDKDKHLYVGIGIGPNKKMSIGVKVGSNDSKSEGLLALIDINGDGLPDKVYKQGGTIYYRANRSGPTGNTSFAGPRVVAGLPDISREKSRTSNKGAEAYMGVTIGVNSAKTFGEQPVYFIDVNGDGLVDLNYNGVVLFNHINANGDPFFTPNNADTPYPIGQGALQLENLLDNFEAVYQENIDTFPLLDTVRRWVAPYDGQIRIGGTVALQQDTSADRQSYTTADGVRVVIQLNESELWALKIGPTDYAPKSATGVESLTVKKGDVIYFRVQSIVDGAYDQVQWNPEIQYLNVTPALDANGLDSYAYNATKDFTLAGYRGMFVSVPFAGTVRLEGQLQKGKTTDDLTLQVLKNDEVIDTQTLTWEQAGSLIVAKEIQVAKADRLGLRLKIDSSVDLAQLQWTKPVTLFYTATSELPAVTDADGQPLVKLNLTADYDLYPESELTSPLIPWTVPQAGEYTLATLVAAALGETAVNGTVIATVKGQGQLLGKYPIQIVNGQVTNGTVKFLATQDQQLYFELSTLDPELGNKLSQKAVGVTGPDGKTYSVPSEFRSASPKLLIPQAYRGWNVFGYDGNRERAEKPIVLSPEELSGQKFEVSQEDMQAKADEVQQVAEQWKQDSEAGQPIDDSTIPKMPLADMVLKPFYPDAATQRWQSTDEEAWLAATVASSSRNGIDNIEVPRPQQFAGASAVPRLNRSKQLGFSLGVSLPPIPASLSASMSDTKSYGLLDMMDLNGDSFPDVLGACGAQYTNMLGALEGGCHGGSFSGDVRNSDGSGVNFGIGGSYPFATPNGKGKMDATGSSGGGTANHRDLMASLGVSANVTKGKSDAKREWIDVNGDGLPDLVTPGLSVALNLGYTLAPPEPWGSAAINHGENKGFTLGGSMSFNDGIYGFGGGLNLSRSESKSTDATETLLDVNGDGLVDKVRGDSNLSVSFNTGNGFAPAVSWPSNGMSETANIALGGGVYFTIGIPLGPLPICIIINPGFDANTMMARAEASLNDIDGDGHPDLLQSKNDGSINVSLSQVKRTNLLKAVHNPLGGTIEVD
ncbi:MAG: hypothetical protein BWK78_06475, partial [Thiotrichaceae bacterium IS1]